MSVCEISIRRRVGFDLARCRKFKRTGAGRGATPAAAIRATESHPGEQAEAFVRARLAIINDQGVAPRRG